jgi:hypothetical protein
MTSETDEIGRIAEQINILAPQIEAMNAAFQPLVEMFTQYLRQMGITMDVGAIYLKKRGILVYGIIFQGPEESLKKIIPYIGGVDQIVGGKEEEKEE